MQVMNTTDSPITIAAVYTIPAGSLRTFDDGKWAELRQRKAVQYWLGEGKLKELGAATEAAPQSVAAVETGASTETSGDAEAATEAATRDPLDHDGDGRKGGSKKKKAS
jgi:hypothetical protein